MVSLIGSAVAEIRTGPRNRKEKGFCRPPVKNKKSSQFDDVQGQRRRRVKPAPAACIGLNPICRDEMSRADRPTMATQGATSTSNSSPWTTMKMATKAGRARRANGSRNIVSRRT